MSMQQNIPQKFLLEWLSSQSTLSALNLFANIYSKSALTASTATRWATPGSSRVNFLLTSAEKFLFFAKIEYYTNIVVKKIASCVTKDQAPPLKVMCKIFEDHNIHYYYRCF